MIRIKVCAITCSCRLLEPRWQPEALASSRSLKAFLKRGPRAAASRSKLFHQLTRALC